ncbi:fumarylacetoacetate hydrolase family protein [Rhizobium paknamense]|uniref:2-keto-4-pentenoate hydratase/2-oxohepta-3-ene-1,7-dioic acid hydratase in catechol pathway n=1 Tax=Rhizobium paknamense TaxID=1206817 RepID=A0ABU0IF05_9HYPH|nr:fumarylacetoacetate hydrolase family protein [Rhizobium paknamense]MDQ0456820.1 2-keto-4-pentenoate hydratase/2-oxohepta-3-ene-1,7-dioic acid hydratase in catechol pathway [Rhizobium paknamense]
MADDTTIPFILGMFTTSGSPAFPALVLDDDAAIAVEALAPLAARLGLALTGKESVFGLLQNWDHNFAALSAALAALADAKAGKYFRSALTASEFLTPCAPIDTPRQVLSELTGLPDAGELTFMPRLVSSVVGPKAKIPLPRRAGKVVAEAKIGVVVGQPAYQSSLQEAQAAIAGYLTVTDLTLLQGKHDRLSLGKFQPSFLPTGPLFVPKAFAGEIETAKMNLAVNGEVTIPSSLARRGETLAASLSRLSQDIQFFPGDILCCGAAGTPLLDDLPALGDGDIIETAVSGLGQQTLNTMTLSQQVAA